MKKLIVMCLILGAVCLLLSQTFAGRRQSQQEMNQQASRDFEKADKELNKAYQKLSKALDAKMRAKLVTAQKAWIKFRDAESAFWASQMEGGSAYPMLYAGEKTELTKKRTKELNEDYKAMVQDR